jgi:elongation factor P
MARSMKIATVALVAVALMGHASAFTNSKAAFVPSTATTASRGMQHFSQLNMAAVDTSDIKNGMTVELSDGEPYRVISFSIMKQARGAAKTTIKFKNLMKGTTIENTYRSGEKFEKAMIEKKAAQHTYRDENDNFFFMDMETFEEVVVDIKIVQDKVSWVGEGMECNLVYFKEKVIEVLLPPHVVVQIVETEPSFKGNTANAHTKPAVLSCGATITIPGYLEEGEMIRVDTDKKEFMERA